MKAGVFEWQNMKTGENDILLKECQQCPGLVLDPELSSKPEMHDGWSIAMQCHAGSRRAA